MPHKTWFITSLGLAGLFGCDAPAPDEAPVPRNLLQYDTPLGDCLTDVELTLEHSDGTMDVAKDLADSLAALARPGDQLTLAYAVKPGCSEQHGPRVSLASYTSPGYVKFWLGEKQPARAYQVDTRRATDDKPGKLSVRLPDCFFDLEIAFGEPLQSLGGAAGTYAGEGRRIAAIQGGDSSCVDIPSLSIAAFDTVERPWGDAPLSAHFGWQIGAPKGPVLSCELDLDGDGAIDQVLSPCPTTTAYTKIGALPQHSFVAPGEHRPELFVSDGTRRLWAGTTVYANKLDYRANVRFPEQHVNFVGAELFPGELGKASELRLHYAGLKGMPTFQIGQVLVGHGVPGGYMLRVDKVVKSGATLRLYGEPATLDDAIAGGFLGVRDVQVSTADAHCSSDTCLAEIVPVTGAPGAAPAKQLAIAVDSMNYDLDGPEAPETDEEAKLGVKFTVPLAEGESGATSEAEIFGGLLVKNFTISGLLWGPLDVDIKVAPTVEAAISVAAAIEESFDVGEYYLGTLPTPIPISIGLTPRIDLSSAFKFAGKLSISAPMELVHGATGWKNSFKPVLAGEAQKIEGGPGGEFTLESKIAIVPEIEFSLGFLSGPYVAPVGALGLKAAVDALECKFCDTVFVEGGGEVGWNAPWGDGNLFEPLQVILAEIELFRACLPMPIEICDDDGGGGGGDGGGTWGDVHVVSHDGLLFDFQAGGEFVLARATAGAPLEVQARQEPLGDNLSLSYNTAIAARVDGQRVGFYAGAAEPLVIDGQPRPLAPGQTHTLAGGKQIKHGAAGRYTVHLAADEVLSVRVYPQHLDVGLTLAAAHKGHLEGVLGDANGDPGDDIGIGGGAFLPQPVGFDALYRGPNSFAEAWRVGVGESLFDYAAPNSAATYRAPPFTDMPLDVPASNPAHQAEAQVACEGCPDALRDTCMLDVAFTGDSTFAAACHDAPGTPTEVLYPSDDYTCVSPRYGATLDCSDPKVVFRGPGLADADQYPNGADLQIRLEHRANVDSGWFKLEGLNTTVAPPDGASDWGTRFQCEPLGDAGWGECTYRLTPDNKPCHDFTFDILRWSVRGDGPNPQFDAEAYFSAP